MNRNSPCFGAVYYSFADPTENRDTLREVMLKWRQCWPNKFSRMSRTGDTFRSVAKGGDVEKLISWLFDPHDFHQSLYFTFFDQADNEGVTQQLLFWGREIDTSFISKTPNYIYVQVPHDTPYELCRELFFETAGLCPFHLCLGNYMVPCNPEGQPRSGANACKQLRSSSLLLHEFDSCFRNLEYLKLLEQRGSKFLAHPSQLIALGTELTALCGTTIEAAARAGDGVDVRQSGSACIMECTSNEGLCRAIEFLTPHFDDVGKPWMFWKDPDWASWIQRTKTTNCLSVYLGPKGNL